MSRKLGIAEFIPDIELPAGESGDLFPLRPAMGQTTVFVSIHSPACDACRRYLGELASASSEFSVWDARLVVVVPGPHVADGQPQVRFGTVLADPALEISSPEDAALIVADRYGQVFEACHAGGGHALPQPRQIEEWLKFLGTLCPE